MKSISITTKNTSSQQQAHMLNQVTSSILENPKLAVSNLYYPAFELQSTQTKKNRWTAHVSSSSKLLSTIDLVLNVKPTQTMSCLDIIKGLLLAKNCDVIYTDEILTLHQLSMLKQMSLFSGTEIAFISDMNEFNHHHSDDLEKA